MSSCRSRKRAGLVLIIALWLIVILSIFGLGLARVSYSNYRFIKFKIGEFLSMHAIKEVIELVRYDLSIEGTLDYDTLAELPAEEEYEFGNIRVVYSLIDEERKINITTTPSSILKNMLDDDMDKAVALVNCPSKPFDVKEEVLLVEEIEEEDYLNMKDLITIYGDGRVNINTCSEEVMEALGMDDGLIRRITEFRLGEDGELGTDDDGIFMSQTGIINTLREDSYVSLSDQQTLVSLLSKNMLGVKSWNYEIRADVYMDNNLVDRYSIVIGIKKGYEGYFIKEWRQG